MLKICGSRVSNYFNKVRLVLIEKGIPHQEETVGPSQDEAVRLRSPMGKVPFLETPQGPLCESQVIIEYLEETHPEKPLYPKDPFARAKLRELITVLELHIELVARRLYGQAFFGGTVSEETKQQVRVDLDKGVRAFNQLAKFSPFIAGEELTVADLAAAVHIPYIVMGTKLVLGESCFHGNEKLAEFMKTIAERPSVKQVYAEREAAFQALLARRNAAS